MMWLVENWLAAVIVVGLVGIYFLTYTMNKRTPIPEECRDIVKDAACKSCNNFACSHKG